MQRTLIYFLRGSITVWMTSFLTDLDLTKLVHLYLSQRKQSSWIHTSQRGGQLYCDTSPYKVVFVWCYEFDWLQWVFSDLTIIIFVFQKTSQHFFVSLATSQHLRLCPLHRSEHQTGKNKIACRNLLLPLKQKWNFVNLFSVVIFSTPTKVAFAGVTNARETSLQLSGLQHAFFLQL